MENVVSHNNLNEAISNNLKRIRKEKKLSLGNLSVISGVSKSMLGQIERGESSPTISTLWKIAIGLNVSFTTLMQTELPDKKVIHNTEIEPLHNDNRHFKLYPLFARDKDRSFEILYIEIEPGSTSVSQPHSSGTEEYTMVVAGTFQLKLGEEIFTVNQGSSISYKSDKPHEYHNPSNEVTKLYMIINYK